MKRLPLLSIVAGFSACWSAASLRADVVTSDPNLPVLAPTGAYVYPGGQPTYSGVGLQVAFNNVLGPAFGPVNRVPNGPNEIESFSGQWLGLISVNLNPPVPFSASGPEEVLAFNKVGNTTGVFQTELLAMDLSGNSAYGPFMVRESPTLPSTGQTTITGLGGGLYQIHSFFDVFTELSVDGGQTWIPSAASSHITLEDVQVPEPSAAGLLAVVVLSWSGWRWRRTRS